MARTRKDDQKRGPLAFGKGTKQRSIGYEFWSPRGGVRHGEQPGKVTKRKTHRKERRDGKETLKEDQT